MALKDYLLMMRLPNLFTIPSNIIVGYITFLNPAAGWSLLSLCLIVICSCLIYIAAIIFNDFFDIEIDIREGRLRPLSRGSVTKNTAISIALLCLTLALMGSILVGILSLIISSVIIVIALLYDYKIKLTRGAAAAVGSARALNIIYGASPILISSSFDFEHVQRLTIECTCLFLYVIATMILSAREAKGAQTSRKWLRPPLLLVSLVVLVMIISVAFGVFKVDLLINLILLASVLGFGVYRSVLRCRYEIGNQEIQNLVGIFVLCMVILDSAFASGIFGILFGIAVATLIIPGLILSRLLYVT